MSRIDVTEKILTAKIAHGLKWGDVAAEVGLSKEWVTAACLGQMTLNTAQAEIIGRIFHLAADPKGDRVKIVMSGKFLPYKTY